MSNRKPLGRNQRIAISAIIVPAVIAIISWFAVSPSKPTRSQSTLTGGGSNNTSQNIVGNNNTIVQFPLTLPSQAPATAADAPSRRKPRNRVSQKSQNTVKGSQTDAGNGSASGNENVTRNGNPVDESVRASAQAYAPNGIAIAGGTVNNPTVNNYGPPTSPPAAIHICASESTPDNTGAVYQVFTLTTDSKVDAPRYNFWFGSALPEGTSASSPDMAMNIREAQSDSRYAFQIFQTWYPGQRINVVVRSAVPLELTKESGEHGESFISSSGSCGSGL